MLYSLFLAYESVALFQVCHHLIEATIRHYLASTLLSSYDLFLFFGVIRTINTGLKLGLALCKDLVIVLEPLEYEVLRIELDDLLTSLAGLSVQAELVLEQFVIFTLQL